ncbi:MAG: YegS/Rv2252/BmrU family lipid kinase [Oscillospiraceae bacterium]
MNKKMLLIVNPAAGKGGGVSSLGSVLQVFANGGYVPSVHFTKCAGDATDLVLREATGFDCVCCVGGDGTLSETVAGLVKLPHPPLLGYIPQGTANDVASSLKLPKSSVAAAKTIIDGAAVPLDVGSFGDDAFFTYIAAFGAFTEASYETPRGNKQALGHLAYVLQGMSMLPKLSSYATTVEYDGGEISGDMVFGSVTNTNYVAGMFKLQGPKIELDDGLFEVILIRNPKNVLEMNEIVTKVLSRNFTGDQAIMLHSKKVKFTFARPVKWTRDGENGGAHSQVEISNIHSPIRIMVPKSGAATLPK